MDMGEKAFINKTNRKKYNWPFSGTSASDLLKTNFQVMIDTSVLHIPGFRTFYEEWVQKSTPDKVKYIFISSLEAKDTTISSAFPNVRVLQYDDCNDYISFFQNIKSMGTWLFLTENDKNAQSIIKASRIAGIYLRVYKLDKEGKLRNCISSPHNNKYNIDNSLAKMDSFDLPTEIAHIQTVIRSNQVKLEEGDMVYDSNNKSIRLEREFSSNPQSITYQTDRIGVQAKIYQNPWLEISYFEDKVRLMLKKDVKCEGICWPIDLLYDKNGEFVGILVPKAEGYQLKQQLMSQQGLQENFPQWNRRELTHLTKVILDKIIYLQDRNILFGLINPGAIFVKDEGHVYFTEMDTYQIEGYPILSYERVMQAPELQDAKEDVRLYTKEQDNYEIALLVFMLLMPGKFPYIKGKYRNISESIKGMDFAFRYGKSGEEHGAKEYYGLWRFAWSHLGNELKQAFYNTFQRDQDFSTPEKRRDARFWKKKIEKLEQELQNPYDEESLRIFPRTFKRYNGMRTIQCVKCGINHPDFYYKYPERRICNSCLGKPSEIHFTCKSCGKSFYYDFATLFKYEKLVETKNFSMPTHCPYCRSNKRKCLSCGKLIPTYRINDAGMCYDCGKAARERITKRYYCKCGEIIELTQGQVDFYMRKFGNLPLHCQKCRTERRNGY